MDEDLVGSHLINRGHNGIVANSFNVRSNTLLDQVINRLLHFLEHCFCYFKSASTSTFPLFLSLL